MDSQFTANLEEKLDEIAENKQDWQKLLWQFYEPFIQKIAEGKNTIKSQKVTIPTGEKCPLCGQELVKRNGRFGEFVGCSGYPKCKYIKKEEKAQEDFGNCEKCGKPMVKKYSRNGEFLACSGYPECKNTQSLQNEKVNVVLEGIKCPKDGGDIIERKGKRGKFYGCGNYPKCDFISTYPPTNVICPKCKGLMARRTYRKKEILECISCKERQEI